MSPEQIKGKDVDTRSDLYSLGVMFYEMLTGELPYSANDSFALAFQHVSEPIPRLPSHLAFLQPALNGLLEKQPHKRFATASEFIEALIDIEHRQGIGSQPFALPRRSSKLSRLNITGIASIMLVGVATGSLFLKNQSSSKAGWPEQSQYELNPLGDSSARPAVSVSLALAEQTETTESLALINRSKEESKADLLLAKARIEHKRGASTGSIIGIVEQGLALEPSHSGLLSFKNDLLLDSTSSPVSDAEMLEEESVSAESDEVVNDTGYDSQQPGLSR
jgi:serine/threonine protein kinase